MTGINNLFDFIKVDNLLQRRLIDKFINQGVLIKRPESCYFGYDTKIEKKVIIVSVVVLFCATHARDTRACACTHTRTRPVSAAPHKVWRAASWVVTFFPHQIKHIPSLFILLEHRCSDVARLPSRSKVTIVVVAFLLNQPFRHGDPQQGEILLFLGRCLRCSAVFM